MSEALNPVLNPAIGQAIQQMMGRGGGATIPPEYALAFSALAPNPATYELTDVLLGTGGMTTVHADPLYAPDHEGVYHEFGVNEPVWSGGRVVTNIVLASEDITDANWNSVTSSAIDETTWETDGIFQRVQQNTPGVSVIAGDSIIYTVDVQFLSGDATTELAFIDVASQPGLQFTPNSTLRRYTFSETVGASGTANMFISVRTNPSVATRFKITRFQVEVSTGRTDTAKPSEYIVTTTAPVTKVFANVNGNSVTDNIVTEAVGAPLAEMPYLDYVPAAENSAVNSNNATLWSSSALVALDAIGLTGKANTATTFTQETAASYRLNNPPVTADVIPITAKMWIKKSATAPSGTVELYLRQNPLTTRYRIGFDPSTGVVTGIQDSVGGSSYEVISQGDWWIVMMSYTTAVSQTQIDFRLYPDTGAGVGYQVILGQYELHLNKTIAEVRGLPPIFTTTAPVATDETEYSYDYANHDNDAAAYYVEWQSPVSSAWTDGARQIISTITSTNMINVPSSSTQMISTWTGNAASRVNQAFSANTTVKAAIVYHRGDNKLAVNQDGTYGAEVVYTGSYAGTAIYLGSFATAVPCKFRNIRRYDIGDYDSGKTKIDELMS